MKNVWLHFLYGYARMRVDGPYGERFLNRCIENNINIWNIKRVGDNRIVCHIALEDISRIRPLLKMTSCRVRFTERRGIPFVLHRMKIRSGFTIGLLAFIAILLIFSNMVWKVSIEGASPEVEYKLKQELQDMGIKRGKFLFTLPNVEDIQKQVTDKLEDATWVGVRLNGTTFHFEVVQQTLPEERDLINPRHLVAKKKAIIHHVFVEQGTALVAENDFVNKGDLLVSGFIGKEGNTQVVPAIGKIYGEIWYKSDVSIPLTSNFETFTGEGKKTHYINLFGFNIPFWGFQGHEFEEYEVFKKNYTFQLLNWSLPVQYIRKETLEKQQVTREYTEEEAVKVAIEMARQELEQKLPKDATIKGEKVLHQSIDNGKVKLKLHYQVIEDISEEQPIIQGD